jgi:ATP-dependent Clp protease ATP-binding subunit ClpA
MLPALNLKIVPIGVALTGVTRRGGRASPDEDNMSSARRRVERAPSSENGATRLLAIATELRAPTASANSLSRRWQASVCSSMAQKADVYMTERNELRSEIEDAQAKVAAYVRQARSGGDDALADDRTSSWDVAESVSARWRTLVLQAASLERIVLAARRRHDLIGSASGFASLRAELASAVQQLATDFASQDVLLEATADLIDAFVRSPLVSAKSFLNYLLLGPAGAGKTRMATALANVLGKIGIFVYDHLVISGRSDYVAEYEGAAHAP